MSLLSANDLVFNKMPNGEIYGGGFNLNSILMKKGISPIRTINHPHQIGGNVSDLFNNLAVPNWALSYGGKRQDDINEITKRLGKLDSMTKNVGATAGSKLATLTKPLILGSAPTLNTQLGYKTTLTPSGYGTTILGFGSPSTSFLSSKVVNPVDPFLFAGPCSAKFKCFIPEITECLIYCSNTFKLTLRTKI